MTYSISPQFVKALLPFAGTDVLRPAMCGINVEVGADETRYVCTDGTKLAILRDVGYHSTKPATFIIPTGACKAIAKLHKKPAVAVERTGNRWIASIGDVVTVWDHIDESYPNYRAVLSSVSGDLAPAHYTGENRIAFDRAAEALGQSSNHVQIYSRQNRAGCVTIEGDDRFFGLIMPYMMPNENLDPAVPHWACAAV